MTKTALDAWRKYRHQTGEWPLRSIAFSFLHLLFEIATLVLIVWYGVQHGWSKGIFLLIVLPLITVDVLVSNWLQNRIRLYEIEHHRRARGL